VIRHFPTSINESYRVRAWAVLRPAASGRYQPRHPRLAAASATGTPRPMPRCRRALLAVDTYMSAAAE